MYLYIIEKALSSILIQEGIDGDKSVYFVSKVLKRVESHYQKIERLALTFVITAKKLRSYFQGHQIIIKMNYLAKQVLKKLDIECMVGRAF